MYNLQQTSKERKIIKEERTSQICKSIDSILLNIARGSMRAIFLFIILVFLMPSFMFSQDTLKKTPGYTVIKSDLVYPLLWVASPRFYNMFSLSAEKSTMKNQSIQLSGKYNTIAQTTTNQYSVYGTNYSTISKTVQSMFQVITEYRFYTGKNKFYAGPFLKYAKANDRTETVSNTPSVQIVEGGLFEAEWHVAGAGGFAGYQFFFLNHFAVDLLLGLGVRKIIIKKINTGKGDVNASLGDGFFSINIGYRW